MAKEKWCFILTALLLFILVLNVLLLLQVDKLLAQRSQQAQAALPPPLPVVQLTAITPDTCPECFSILPVLEILKQQQLTIKEERLLSASEGRDLMERYNVKKLPTIILTGEVNRTTLSGFVPVKDALVYMQTPAPYQLVSGGIAGELVGKVHARILEEPGCVFCDNLTQIPLQLRQMGVLITHETISAASDEGKTLVQQYKIKKLPTILLSSDAGAYPMIQQAWSQLGTVEEDGTFMMRDVLPPYIELPSRKLRGSVELVVLTDKSCASCYDPAIHSRILAQYGLVFSSNRTEDISSGNGKSIVQRYNITAVPTVLLRGDVGVYSFLASRWRTIGTVEKDGTYIFRNPGLIPGATYKDLRNGTLMTAPASAPAAVPDEQEGMT